MKVLIMSAIYPTPENPAFGTFVRTQVESLRRAGIDIELLLLNGRSRKWNYPKAVFQLRRRLADRSIDLIHAHYSYVGIVARTQSKVPVVVTYHGSDVMGLIAQTGKKALWSPLAVGAGRMLARNVDAAIAQTAKMASLLPQKSNVFIIPCEIDFEVFRLTDRHEARAALGLRTDKKYLLFAANPQIAVKRFSLAKAVADEAKKKDSSIELLVVCREPQDRLALYMNACDALVFTSYQEGSPNVIKQAMACNLPIVSTDVGDVREVIGNTAGCFVCQPDVGEFAERLLEILSDRRRTQGRAQVQHLAGPAVARRIIDVYEQVLKKREARLAYSTQTVSLCGQMDAVALPHKEEESQHPGVNSPRSCREGVCQ
jgi:glycosyltransferase involved in cell wall biosynthesis